MKSLQKLFTVIIFTLKNRREDTTGDYNFSYDVIYFKVVKAIAVLSINL